jgi:threonine/homoserine/homoserine lactone efflux protein
MTLQLFWQGCLVGMLAAVPLGPMGIIAVQRTMTGGRWSGLASAAGLTVALALWCVVAMQGLALVTGFVLGKEWLLRAGLGFFLMAAGLQGVLNARRIAARVLATDTGTLAAHFTSSFLGVALNPVTFVTLTAVLAVLKVVRGRIPLVVAAELAVAVFLGGMAFWVVLTHALVALRRHLGEHSCARISFALSAGVLVLGCGYLASPLF